MTNPKQAVLHIGNTFLLPLETITETVAILGIRGSGKTNTAVVIAEELLENGQQVVVIDPTDVWWGLKSSSDGKRAGFPVVIMGGKRADLPLEATDGAVLADFVVDDLVSVVLSLRHFESKGAVRRFVTDFARRLYFRKGQQENPRPLMVIIDEASLVVPQRVMGEDAAMVGAIQQLVRQGRSSGIGVTLIDQRPATVNKDVLAMLELLVCHRVTSPQDRKALMAWIEQHDTEDQAGDFLDTLSNLKQGHAWFWSPGWLDVFKVVHVRARNTFDSSRTPKAGERVVTPRALASVDLDALKLRLTATIEKAKADDPALLRKTLAERDREILQLRRHKCDTGMNGQEVAAKLVEARAQGYNEGAAAAIQEAVVVIAPLHDQLKTSLALHAAVGTALRGIPRHIGFVRVETEPEKPVRHMGPGTGQIVGAVRRAHANDVQDEVKRTLLNEEITESQQRILDAIAALNAIGISAPIRLQVAFFSRYTVGGRFNRIVGELRTHGLIDYADGGITLTKHGETVADPETSITSLAKLHKMWLDKLSPSEAKILDVLLANYPESISREELATKTHYTVGGRFNRLVGHLSSLGAAYYPSGSRVSAAPVLFPEGLL